MKNRGMIFKFYFWMLAYSVAYELAEYICTKFGIDNSFVALIIFLFTAVLLIWLYKNNYTDIICTKRNALQTSEYVIAIPLLIMPVCNLYFSERFICSWSYFLLMLCVAVIEEIFFRGFLQKFFMPKGVLSAVIKTNIVFSLYHLVNIYNIENMGYVFCQLICAFLIGVCYSFTAIHFKSIVLCVIAHFLTNITAGVSDVILSPTIMTGITVAYSIYALLLFFKYKSISTINYEEIG